MLRLTPRLTLWATRVSWLVTAVVVSFALDDGAALSAWWVVAAAVLVALVVCGPLALTIVRMVAPTALAVAVAVLVTGSNSVLGVAAVASALLATLTAFQAETGEAVVQMSAYGAEQRLPLRVPAAMQPLMVASWLLWCAMVIVGALLVADDRHAAGITLLVIGAALTWPVVRRLHRFATRWLVSVPAGVVVHDSVVLGETLLVLRPNVAAAHLALADTRATDLTGPAAGHAVELEFREDVTVSLAAPRQQPQPRGSVIHTRAVLIAPSRPGRALRVLGERGISVG